MRQQGEAGRRGVENLGGQNTNTRRQQYLTMEKEKNKGGKKGRIFLRRGACQIPGLRCVCRQKIGRGGGGLQKKKSERGGLKNGEGKGKAVWQIMNGQPLTIRG